MKERFPRLYRHLAARFTPGEQFGLHLTVGIILMLFAVWVFGSIADEVIEQEELTVLDTHLANWFHQHKASVWTPIMLFITNWHDMLGVSLMTVVLLTYLARQRARYWQAAVLLSVPGGMLLNVLLKYTFQRARPSFDEPLVTLTTYSFPSGHTVAATVFYGVLACYLVCVCHSWRVRVAVVAVAGTMVALVALSRVYLGAHYLSDVMAAVAVGAAWVTICITAMSTLRRRREVRASD
jgi:membrane-associated phospholipid phosphatase